MLTESETHISKFKMNHSTDDMCIINNSLINILLIIIILAYEKGEKKRNFPSFPLQE